MTSTDQASSTNEAGTEGADTVSAQGDQSVTESESLSVSGEGAPADEPTAEAPAESPADDVSAEGDRAEGDSAEGDSAEGEDDADGDDNPLDVEAEVAADYLEELLDIADLDGDIDTYVDADRAHVSIVSDSETLVGRDGQVLDALQELTRLAVLAETGQRSRLMLDVAGYRAKRRGELMTLATDAVQEVKDSGEPVHLKAMNPFERKIVHDAVAAAGLTSESEGEEPRRHVVILPAGD